MPHDRLWSSMRWDPTRWFPDPASAACNLDDGAALEALCEVVCERFPHLAYELGLTAEPGPAMALEAPFDASDHVPVDTARDAEDFRAQLERVIAQCEAINAEAERLQENPFFLM
jgi:hypothetical protein